MNNYRVSALSTMIIVAIMMTVTADVSARARHGAVNHKPVFHAAKWMRLDKVKKIKHRRKAWINKNTAIGNTEQHQSLNLEIPFKAIPEASAKRPLNGLQETSDSSLFDSRNKSDDVQVKGQFVMSQEPEADKKKSADGAGIVINLRR